MIRISILLQVLSFVMLTGCGDINAGLVAHYPFNGDANDRSGNNYEGVVNGATLTQDRFGNANSAYEFDGQDDYIALPQNINLLDTDFSISVFLKPDDYGKQSSTSSFCARTIISHRFRAHKNGDPMNSGLILRLTKGRGCDGNNFFSGRFIDPSSQYNPITYQYTATNAYDWFHYTITRASDTMTIYLNANVVAEVDVSPQKIQMNSDQAFTTIGANIHGNNQFFFPFDGVLDDVRIYDRALSASEVQQLYKE